jgi:glycosyltransferase involved in cell wall biosynthesis
MRVAVATESISHFEIPLYRLLSKLPGVELKVFHLMSTGDNEVFDNTYLRPITWGEDMLGCYSAQQCSDWRHIFNAIRHWSTDVVILNGYAWPGALPLLVAVKAFRMPVVFRGTLNYHMDPRIHGLPKLKRLIRKPIFHCFDALQCGSSYARRVFHEAGVSDNRLFFVPFSVDSPHFLTESNRLGTDGARAAVRAELNVCEDHHLVMFVGQLSWFKGPDIAIEAFARFHTAQYSARMLVVGDGAMMRDLRGAVRQAGLDDFVKFVGFHSSKQLSRYYLAADVALFTSRYETWARAVNEAMLCRCPCILNTVIPAVDLITNGVNGYVVNPADVANYVTALKQHVSLTPAERVAMGDAARERAWAWSYEQNTEPLLHSLEYALSRHPRADPDRLISAPKNIPASFGRDSLSRAAPRESVLPTVLTTRDQS